MRCKCCGEQMEGWKGRKYCKECWQDLFSNRVTPKLNKETLDKYYEEGLNEEDWDGE